MARMTVCIHDGTKMLSNPLTNGRLFWCPKCGNHDCTTVRRNGHKPAEVAPPSECGCIDLSDGRQRTCPTCRDRAQRSAIPF